MFTLLSLTFSFPKQERGTITAKDKLLTDCCRVTFVLSVGGEKKSKKNLGN